MTSPDVIERRQKEYYQAYGTSMEVITLTAWIMGQNIPCWDKGMLNPSAVVYYHNGEMVVFHA